VKVSKTDVPRREWLAVLFPPAAASVLLAAGARDAASTPHGWLAFIAALAAGFVPSILYTLVLAREGRLFPRDSAAIERNRDRIIRVGIPIGWVLAGGLVTASVLLDGFFSVVFASALAGAVLGFWPGILANFIRLRREVWTR
jgi:hypothetical protein